MGCNHSYVVERHISFFERQNNYFLKQKLIDGRIVELAHRKCTKCPKRTISYRYKNVVSHSIGRWRKNRDRYDW